MGSLSVCPSHTMSYILGKHISFSNLQKEETLTSVIKEVWTVGQSSLSKAPQKYSFPPPC